MSKIRTSVLVKFGGPLLGIPIKESCKKKASTVVVGQHCGYERIGCTQFRAFCVMLEAAPTLFHESEVQGYPK